MYILVMILHVFACIVLIGVILLQSGRGGGLSDMFGGGAQQQQKMFGTQTNVFMTRMTSYCAIMFLITSIILGVMTSHRSRSLLESAKIEPIFDQTPVAEEVVKEEEAPATVAETESAPVPIETPSMEEVVQKAESIVENAAQEAEEVMDEVTQVVTEMTTEDPDAPVAEAESSPVPTT